MFVKRGLSYNKMSDCHQYTVDPCLDTFMWGIRQGFGSLLCLRGSSSHLLSAGLKSLGYKAFVGAGLRRRNIILPVPKSLGG